MSTQVSFVGASFRVQSATSTEPGRVRVRFTQDPRQADPNLISDGLRPQNYVFVGPSGSVSVVSVSIVAGDPQSLDLNLSGVLPTGNWVLTVSNVLTPFNVALQDSTASFSSVAFSNATELTAGSEAITPSDVIRKHLSPAMAGPNWDAVVEALSQGDVFNEDNARLAFDQMFKASASGKYLDRLAANDGITRPSNLGMGDEVFRLLATRLHTNKLTHEALREILEVFYGRDSVRAYAECELEQPFVLTEGQDLTWTLDEDQTFRYVVGLTDFTLVDTARADELAAALTKTMLDAGSTGFAAALQHPETGGYRVRIYSGSLGLKSFVRITGGTAQPFLHFPTYRNVYSGDVPGYTWTVSAPEQGVTKFSLTTTGQPLIDISTVEEGDYVVIGPAASPLEAGTYTVRDAGFSWSGADITQFFELDADLGYTGSFVQDQDDDFQFFQPFKRNILNGERTVVVAQTVPKTVDIQIPATTQAVNRTARTGAYARVRDSYDIKRYVRDGSGNVSIELEDTLAVTPDPGNLIFLDDVRPGNSRPWVSLGEQFGEGSGGTTDASYGTTWSGMNVPPTPMQQYCEAVVTEDGTLFTAGGFIYTAGVATTNTSSFRLQLQSSAAVTDTSEAEGATRWTYDILNTGGGLTFGRFGHAMSLLLGQPFVTGGFDIGFTVVTFNELWLPDFTFWVPYNILNTPRGFHLQFTLDDDRVMVIGGSDLSVLASTEIFDPVTTDTNYAAPMNVARYAHRGVKLSDGRIMVTGGSTTFQYGASTDATNTVEFYDPDTDTWTMGPDMFYSRAFHQMVQLPDGRILVFGGRGQIPDQAVPASDELTSAEVWDPVTNLWYPAPSTTHAWISARTAWINGKLFVATGELAYDSMEVMNASTLQWAPHFLRVTVDRDRMFDMGNGIAFLTGGFDGSDSYTHPELLIGGADAVSGGGLNGPHEVVSATGTTIDLSTPSQPSFSTNLANPTGAAGTSWDPSTQLYIPADNYAYSLASGARVGNVTTLTLYAGKTTAGLEVGQRVYVNINGAMGSALTGGWQTILDLTDTTVVYADTGSDVGDVLTGAVTVDQNPHALVTQACAEARATQDLGPYIFDVDDGLSVTAVEVVLSTALEESHHYDRIQVSSTADFPDSTGYIVLGFGTENQSRPIKYLEKVGTNLLLIDFGYAVEHDYDTSTTVTLLKIRGSFVPDEPLDAANCYITGSSAGRVAAQAAATAAAAAGITLDFNIIYPGDRGLGGEGYPTEGDTKLSDAVRVWGGDNLDEGE